MSHREPTPEEIILVADAAGWATFQVVFPKAEAYVFESSYNLRAASGEKAITLARVLEGFRMPPRD